MEKSTHKNSIINTVKLYLFPSLITILAMLIWREVTELRSDVKMLLAQSNVDKTKIEILEKDVHSLEQAVFNKKFTADLIKDTASHNNKQSSSIFSEYFKHEEFFNIEDNLITNPNTL